ncbi:hypothetical protein VNO78_10519 [Psophocarpus tetragonolobus]|uniref:Magnesium transporter n=1 Tax=Psophocarpus tetragonolobus TaxID=3891 RepID=A0AAN9XN22_PSOTE
MRRKNNVGMMGVKSWMVVSETGEAHLEDIGKHSIMRRTGLPARILTATHLLFLNNSSNPFFLRFLRHLHTRLTLTPSPITNYIDGAQYSQSQHASSSAIKTSDAFHVRLDTPNIFEENMVTIASSPHQLPFEFRALETCIESACSCLQSETSTLEEEAYPALDELTSHLCTLNLERVRQIKSRLVALSGRVQKVADELEHLLDDDNHMAEMYLTQKLNARVLDQTSLKEEYNSESEDSDQSDESLSSEKIEKFSGFKLDVEELEMLLEAYFAQINGILQRLSSLSEYVDDTEDYINIMLDDKRNELLQVAIIFNTLNMILNAGIVVVGLFGMNIQIQLFNGQPHQFWATTGGTFGGCILVFLIFFWWGKKKYLLSR